MQALYLQHLLAKDGEILITGLPYKTGQQVNLLILQPQTVPKRLTVRQLRASGLLGLWANRQDIQDSAEYARQLRQEAQQRELLK